MKTHRILTLQVLRGIVANMVVISHIMGAEHRHLGGTFPSELHVGFAGVDIFFVLSGFVMVRERPLTDIRCTDCINYPTAVVLMGN